METTGETISRPRWQLSDDRGQVPTLYPFCGMWAAKRNRRAPEMTTQTTFTATDVTADTSGLVALTERTFGCIGILTRAQFEHVVSLQTEYSEHGQIALCDALELPGVISGPFSPAQLREILSVELGAVGRQRLDIA